MENNKSELQHWLRRLLFATVALYAVVIALVGYTWSDSHKQKQALCTLRVDLQRRVDDSYRFISDHPHGIPGISVATIRQGINGQQRTIKSLSKLNC